VDDMTIRPYSGTDAGPVTDLLNAMEVATGGDAFFTVGEVSGILKAEIQDAIRDSRLVFAPDGALVAAGMIAAPPPGGSRVRANGGVHPWWRGRGIGRELLAWQIERADEIRSERDPGTPWTVGAGASTVDEGAIRLFRRFGLRPVRYFLEMTGPTADPPAVRPPAGIRVADYAGDLRTAVYEAHMEAFADHWGFQRSAIERWAAMTIDSEPFRGDLSRIAFDGDRIAAYLLAYDGAGNHLYIGQVGTRRRWRKQGLATALLATSLGAGARAGKEIAVLGVDADSPTGAVDIYERAGFTVRHEPYAVHEKLLAVGRRPVTADAR
jgi:ribosomal protein S18 acetylase RimI-like enzyme